eukprot:15470481-Alexandrium_andersonii.AAC.1
MQHCLCACACSCADETGVVAQNVVGVVALAIVNAPVLSLAPAQGLVLACLHLHLNSSRTVNVLVACCSIVCNSDDDLKDLINALLMMSDSHSLLPCNNSLLFMHRQLRRMATDWQTRVVWCFPAIIVGSANVEILLCRGSIRPNQTGIKARSKANMMWSARVREDAENWGLRVHNNHANQ